MGRQELPVGPLFIWMLPLLGHNNAETGTLTVLESDMEHVRTIVEAAKIHG